MNESYTARKINLFRGVRSSDSPSNYVLSPLQMIRSLGYSYLTSPFPYRSKTKIIPCLSIEPGIRSVVSVHYWGTTRSASRLKPPKVHLPLCGLF
ncbi:hypothetical protein COLO4_04480 [Corchorus olitorius]|uniref:Uncharacterized protein n=1 Tax=Corchorus olitorius TaxID=93759 RepID=A0A1R3KTU9_9ROSI|nr:hypothetical protein COLO4_04480 [Corchorus olitorius]